MLRTKKSGSPGERIRTDTTTDQGQGLETEQTELWGTGDRVWHRKKTGTA